jgi:nucleotide-binding universal stress UspA family protein
MFHNVIVGTDGYEAGADALWLARQLAAADAELTLAYVQVVIKPDADAGAISLAAERLPVMERLASLRDESHVDARVLCVQAGSVAAGLQGLAINRAADLLVIGASRRDDLDRAFDASDTSEVLESAPCPVAVTPTGYATRRPHVRTIAAAYNGSPESEEAVAVARQLAGEHGAELQAIEAVPEPVRVSDPWQPQPEIDAGVAQARERIAGLGGVEPRAASGEAVDVLARAGDSVDLLVLGSHEYRPLDHVFDGGSTAQRLADRCTCPLLVLSASRAPER